MRATKRAATFGALAVFALAAAEVLIMISPFAGFFYASLRFEPLLGTLSQSPWTGWLDGFFLNHAVVTDSILLEWQRKIGMALFAIGLLGFGASAFQVYGNKVLKRGVARGLLYRYVRHPQYSSLSLAGWGLLTMWPRLLLLGIWITMLFCYAALARFEEQRMEEKFGEEYGRFAATRGAFLPGSPLRRVFEAAFGQMRPRWLGWTTAYTGCLTLAFCAGFLLRDYTIAHTAIDFQPNHRMVIVSTWPKPAQWMERVVETALADHEVGRHLRERRGNSPVVATILAPHYPMTHMYYKLPSDSHGSHRKSGFPSMGVDPDRTRDPVQVVFSTAHRPYRHELSLKEVFDPGVRLTPLLVVHVVPARKEVSAPRHHPR